MSPQSPLLAQNPLVAGWKVTKDGLYRQSAPSIKQLVIALNAHAKRSLGSRLEIAEPQLPNELSIATQMGDLDVPKVFEKTSEQVHPLQSIGIATLIQHAPHQRDGDASVNHSQHQDIEHTGAKLPFRSIHREHPGFGDVEDGYQRFSHCCFLHIEPLEEALDAFVI